jgi:hypothetical protein
MWGFMWGMTKKAPNYPMKSIGNGGDEVRHIRVKIKKIE